MPILDTGADNDVARRQMPQIPQNQLAEYVRFLRLNDVKVDLGQVPAKLLRPLQDHVDQEKVAKMLQEIDKTKKSFVVVSESMYIIDGHHRWYAMHEAHPGTLVRIIHVHLPVKEVVELSHEFEGSYTAGIHEIQLAQLIRL